MRHCGEWRHCGRGWGHCERSEALWEDGGIVEGGGPCGRMGAFGKSEALWEDVGIVQSRRACGRSEALWREKDRT